MIINWFLKGDIVINCKFERSQKSDSSAKKYGRTVVDPISDLFQVVIKLLNAQINP